MDDAGNSAEIDHRMGDVLSVGDYYPFGLSMTDRELNSCRYGFNGKKRSKKIGMNSFTAEYWQYDARVMRRWNLDPVVKE